MNGGISRKALFTSAAAALTLSQVPGAKAVEAPAAVTDLLMNKIPVPRIVDAAKGYAERTQIERVEKETLQYKAEVAARGDAKFERDERVAREKAARAEARAAKAAAAAAAAGN